ncbi:MAG: PBSX family phage terminase large subunit [Firmicutes bacterium]|nr:PBSX family phage terminase large subunit [Bacillota bacterium]
MATIDDDIALAEWWRDLRRTSNADFLPLFFDEHRYLVLCGGGGSGKSIFAGRKVLERVICEKGHRWLVCRKVAKTLRDSCFAQLRGQIAEHYPGCRARVNRSDMRITFPNGSEILFAGLDDVEKLKSIYDITGIWIEEASEITEADFNQLDIRLRTDFDQYLQMILSFNPISITHWLKRRFFDQPDERARTHRSTYRDNRFLTAEAIETLEAFKDSDPYYYQVYCLGEWGVTGKTVFDGQAVSERLNRLTPPVKRGFWTYIYGDGGLHTAAILEPEWTEAKDGPICIFREPEEGRPYVIGGDTSGEGSDFFVAQVLDNITGEQVAVLRHQYDEDTYAEQVYCLGKYFNDALVGIETNFSTFPIRKLEMLGYTNQYVRELPDTYTGAVRKAFGFRTNAQTRPVIVGELVEAMRSGIDTVNDRTTLEEMLTFVRNEKLRAEAEPGAHDDCVMALAIAWHIRPQQRMTVLTAEPEGKARWTQDMWDDYYSADAETRRYLVAKWGEPKR